MAVQVRYSLYGWARRWVENRRGGHGAQKKVVACGAVSGGRPALAVSPGSGAGPRCVMSLFTVRTPAAAHGRRRCQNWGGAAGRANFVDVLVLNSRWHDSFCLKPGACVSPMSWVGSQS